jgi:hypothetical protein
MLELLVHTLFKVWIFHSRRTYRPSLNNGDVMFADPYIVTVNAVAQSMSRTSMGNNSATYRKDDGLYRLSISHQLGKSFNQRVIRLDRSTLVSDPFTTGNQLYADESVWLVSKSPSGNLVTVANQKQLVDGFLAKLTASSGADITKLLAGES